MQVVGAVKELEGDVLTDLYGEVTRKQEKLQKTVDELVNQNKNYKDYFDGNNPLR